MAKPLLLGLLLTVAVATVTLVPLMIIGASPNLIALVGVLDICAAGLISGLVAERLPPPEDEESGGSGESQPDTFGSEIGTISAQAAIASSIVNNPDP